MALAVYKPGQGYWTRMLTAIGTGTLVLCGVAWLWANLDGIKVDKTRLTVQASMAVGIIGVFGILLWYLLNKPRIVDFMIATEAEMRKVNWPTQREVVGSTVVVICGTFLMALYLWVINLSSAGFFKIIKVLPS